MSPVFLFSIDDSFWFSNMFSNTHSTLLIIYVFYTLIMFEHFVPKYKVWFFFSIDSSTCPNLGYTKEQSRNKTIASVDSHRSWNRIRGHRYQYHG